MHHALITVPFADRDHAFKLGWLQLEEWERVRDKSLMGAFSAMVQRRDGHPGDVREIVRLALIGGGLPPLEALALVKTYVEQRPLAETFELALTIAEAAIFGSPEWQAAEKAKPMAPVDG